ncbi:MAG: type II toxin-antitoxin system Phd/YefM family antitoxin [Dehalococcoidia bacterium]|jgi:prevent-host-death family protein|nr:type II toxin-antitoxin system Phd/YefM family antitoxin [Dehalococcoidia bacterium]
MLKKISAQKARQNFGELMDEVRLRGDRYIVNRGEKPLVAVIPVEEYLAWEQARERLYSRIVMMRDRTRREDAEVLEGEIRQAIAAVG